MKSEIEKTIGLPTTEYVFPYTEPLKQPNNKPGIYIIVDIDNNTVLYVGSSGDVQKRINENHHIIKKINKRPLLIYVTYETPKISIQEEEQRAIELLKPILNIQYNTRSENIAFKVSTIEKETIHSAINDSDLCSADWLREAVFIHAGMHKTYTREMLIELLQYITKMVFLHKDSEGKDLLNKLLDY